jgi:predicted O-linked N-acetylglucosamine transferase (SPINDLY family)
MINTLDNQLNQAIDLQENGNLFEAERIYQLIIKEMPRNPLACHNLGLIKAKSGNLDMALELLKIAVDEYPISEQFWFSYLETLVGHKQLEIAKRYLKKAKKRGLSSTRLSKLKSEVYALHKKNNLIALPKSSSPSHLQLKQILEKYNSGDLDAAFLAAKPIAERHSQHPMAWKILSFVYQRQGKLEQALTAAKTAIKLDGQDAQAYFQLGRILYHLDRLALAVESYQNCISLDPKNVSAHNDLAIALQNLGNLSDAKSILLQSISLEKINPHAFNNLGSVYLDLGQLKQAEKNFRLAISLQPNYSEAHNNLGSVFFSLGKLDEAERYFSEALKIQPDNLTTIYNLGVVSEKKMQPENALKYYERIYLVAPNYDYLIGAMIHVKMRLAIWDDLDNHLKTVTKSILKGERSCKPFATHSLIGDPKIQKVASEIYWHSIIKTKNTDTEFSPYKDHGRIKIGYFSPDFKNHPVTHQTAGLYSQHDRSHFEVHAFFLGTTEPDIYTNHVKSSVDHFHDVGALCNEDIVTLSRSLEIDIAIDLAGFTEGCRPKIFALSVAPIQIGYIGFLGTMGSKIYDYIISDRTIITEDNKQHYSEKIVYLPSYQVNDSRPIKIDQLLDNSYFNIPQEAFVFCCLNSVYKITPHIFDSWSRILQQVDSSVLLLHSDNDTAKANLKTEIRKRGINPDRLIFAGFLHREQYMARYQYVDIFLDTMPYNGGATASDALRMGVPVITCLGNSFSSRMCASLLKNIGLPELISTSPVQYEEIAIDLACNPTKLLSIKDKLRNVTLSSQLFDTQLFARNLEKAFKKMQANHEHEGQPSDIYIE